MIWGCFLQLQPPAQYPRSHPQEYEKRLHAKDQQHKAVSNEHAHLCLRVEELQRQVEALQQQLLQQQTVPAGERMGVLGALSLAASSRPSIPCPQAKVSPT